ncbi:oxidoreductase [Alteromonas sp. CYL-A6]|uniref:oxidoreductase n=1 Tax=Alteromonas nitratireducens TaxID=3390813 RepID=UPI0034B33080
MSTLFTPFKLTNGTLIKNRIVKSAMSDNLGNGAGIPTPEQISLYEQWAKGGVGVLIVGEVQISPHYPESAGNLVVTKDTFSPEFRQLTETVTSKGCHIWAQLGHAGALSDPSISSPAGPSEIQSDMINARELPQSYLEELPNLYARSALRCKQLGFSGVQIHAAHGFLLSQILSPLFNKRKDKFGGSIHNRFTLIENIIESVRDKVGSRFPVSLKLNCSDFLEGGFVNLP